MFDTTGLAVSAIIGATIVAVGVGIDNLLLERHVKWFNLRALEWWDYFDDLKIVDLPRRGVGLFLKLKTFLLGSNINTIFFVRACLLSAVITVVAIYGGTVFGLYLYGVCSGTAPGEPVLTAAWRMIGGAGNLYYLGPTNFVFDLLTILATTILLVFSIKKNDYILGSIIFIDILVCIFLLEALLYISDSHRTIRLSYNGFGTAIHEIYTIISNANCAIGVLLFPTLIYSSTIIIPTIVYLVIIAALFVLRESFKLTKWFIMHILEKSSEDAKKTLFTHVGVALGIVVTIIKALVELMKIIDTLS